MDVPHSNFLNPHSTLKPKLIFKHKPKTVLCQVKCSSTQQGLKPRPVLKPYKTPDLKTSLQNPPKSDILQETLLRKYVEKPVLRKGLCSEIRKRVLLKQYKDALQLFDMIYCDCEEDGNGSYEVGEETYDALVNACVGLRSIRGVKRVYGYMLKSGFEMDLYMRNRVLLMHVKCEMMIDARRLFGEMEVRNEVTWNMIIGGLVDEGEFKEAFELLLRMREEEEAGVGQRTWALIIRVAAGLGVVEIGRELHCCLVKMEMDRNVFVQCGLIDMYSKCGEINDAELVFNGMENKTLIGWNSMIAGYALHGYSEKALSMYYKMLDLGVKMDHYTYSLIISTCTRLASLEHAKQAHAILVRQGFESNTVVSTALLDFYCKWGKIEDAKHVFDRMPLKNVISWNALIAGYGKHGKGAEAVEVFMLMLHEKKLVPNHVTFLAVLYACSYSGLTDLGWQIFDSMSFHKIKPRAMHYACMIELLGRESRFVEAVKLIREAPFRPTANMWAALLTACRVRNNLELGKLAAEKLYRMEPQKLSNYVVLLNIYKKTGNFKDASDIIKTLQRKGIEICQAHSWIEIKKQTHFFVSGDRSHVETEKIYQTLGELVREVSKYGYVPACKSLLPDVDNQEERVPSCHSEKLAVVFGLISTSGSASLQIVQNHRICRDCHNMIKLISAVTKRHIVIKDSSRFHHFENGACSCGGYW